MSMTPASTSDQTPMTSPSEPYAPYTSSPPPTPSTSPPDLLGSGISSGSSTSLSAATSSSYPVTATATVSASARPNTLAAASSSHAGTIAGSVIGGVVFLALVALGAILYLRARKRKRTAPSSEFINCIRTGTTPVLRLDSGAAYSPALGEKSAGYSAYPPSVPLPFTQDSYYASPLAKFSDETMLDPPSGRPSVEKPLQPQRYSAQRRTSDAFVAHHQPSTSVGSRRELWGSDVDADHSPPHLDSVLQFAPRFALLDDAYPQHSPPSHSPLPLSPLRRQPDPEP